MGYADQSTPLPEITSELGVAYILEGAVPIFGEKVRVTVQLIDGERDEHLWSESIDREASESKDPEVWFENLIRGRVTLLRT